MAIRAGSDQARSRRCHDVSSSSHIDFSVTAPTWSYSIPIGYARTAQYKSGLDLTRDFEQTLSHGHVRAKNDIIVALAGQSNLVQHETACCFIETKKPPFPLNCRQGMTEAIVFGSRSNNPVLQVCPFTACQ